MKIYISPKFGVYHNCNEEYWFQGVYTKINNYFVCINECGVSFPIIIALGQEKINTYYPNFPKFYTFGTPSNCSAYDFNRFIRPYCEELIL